MKNNILGGLVIFLVVVTCLLLLDDISSKNIEQTTLESVQVDQIEKQSDLAVIEAEE